MCKFYISALVGIIIVKLSFVFIEFMVFFTQSIQDTWPSRELSKSKWKDTEHLQGMQSTYMCLVLEEERPHARILGDTIFATASM